MYKLELIGGQHVQTDADGVERTYNQNGDGDGNVFENPKNLAERWPEKFRLVTDETPSEMRRQPGESLRDFAQRMLEAAEAEEANA